MVKLFDTEETSLIKETANVQKLAKDTLQTIKISSDSSNESEDELIDPTANRKADGNRVDSEVFNCGKTSQLKIL